MREKAEVTIPRNSSRRRRVANARIDAILYALIQESWREGGPEWGGCRGRGEEEEERGEQVSDEEESEGNRSTKQGGRNVTAPYSLSNNEVDAVIAYVDRDQSGEVDVEVSGMVGAGREVARAVVRTHAVPLWSAGG